MADELPPVIQAAERFRAALIRGEAQAAARLIRAYGLAYTRLQGDIDALILTISQMPNPTWGQVERLSLYRQLLSQIEGEIGRFSVIAENDIGDGARQALIAALRDSERLVQLSLPGLDAATVRGIFQRLSPEQVETIIGFLADDSPLFQNLRLLGDDVAELVANEIRIGVILGRNPRIIARNIQRATGQGLTWALNMARTSQLWAYREAARASFVANSHIVSGWVWFAELGDPRTCMACIMMHGTIHPVDEILNDHHAGRCAPIPITRTYAELGFPGVPEDRPSIQTGESWFLSLSPAQQREMMGGAAYRAWQAGEIELPQLVGQYDNDVYGQMRREASLVSILGERARVYYAR